jgi:hypothetical protein
MDKSAKIQDDGMLYQHCLQVTRDKQHCTGRWHWKFHFRFQMHFHNGERPLYNFSSAADCHPGEYASNTAQMVEVAGLMQKTGIAAVPIAGE